MHQECILQIMIRKQSHHFRDFCSNSIAIILKARLYALKSIARTTFGVLKIIKPQSHQSNQRVKMELTNQQNIKNANPIIPPISEINQQIGQIFKLQQQVTVLMLTIEIKSLFDASEIQLETWKLSNCTKSNQLVKNGYLQSDQETEKSLLLFNQSLLDYLALTPIILKCGNQSENQHKKSIHNQSFKIKVLEYKIDSYVLKWRIQNYKLQCEQKRSQNLRTKIGVKQFTTQWSNYTLQSNHYGSLMLKILSSLGNNQSPSLHQKNSTGSVVFQKTTSLDKIDSASIKRQKNPENQHLKQQQSTQSIRRISIYELHDQQLQLTLISKDSNSLSNLKTNGDQRERQQGHISSVRQVKLNVHQCEQQQEQYYEDICQKIGNPIDRKWLQEFELVLKQLSKIEGEYL